MTDIPFRAALIVGAGLGISASVARGLASAGLKVGLVARNVEKLAPLAAETGAQTFAVDASDPAAVARLFADADSRLGEPDVVLYNASARAHGPIAELAPHAVRNAIEISAYGGFLVVQQAARRMIPHGRGAILLTGASASVKGYPLSAAFAMGKFALRGLAQSTARELGPKGIHVAHFVIDGAVRSARIRRIGRTERSTPMRSRKPISLSCANRAAPGRWRSNFGRGSKPFKRPTTMTTAGAPSIPYVGQSLRRREDIKFLTGNGRYVDDIRLPGMLYLAILRSPHAHARITGVDLSAARAAAGVRLALAGADLAGKIGNITPNWVVPGTVVPERPVMAPDRVRFVGECVALAVAETREAAYDALERIEVSYEALPVVIDEEAAIGDGAPRLHENVPNNVTTYFKIGGGNYAAAVRQADQVVRLRLVNNRLIPTCLETRAILAEPSTDGRLTIYLPSQVPHVHRRWIAETVGIPEHLLLVVA